MRSAAAESGPTVLIRFACFSIDCERGWQERHPDPFAALISTALRRCRCCDGGRVRVTGVTVAGA